MDDGNTLSWIRGDDGGVSEVKPPGVAKTLLLELTEGGREVRKRGRIREME